MGPGGTWSPLCGSLFSILISGTFTALGALFVVLSITPVGALAPDRAGETGPSEPARALGNSRAQAVR